jgi:hypothetical protein
MDPRHTLYRTFDELTIDPETMSARTDAEAASAQASSGVTADSIERKLREELGAVHVEIADLSGTFMFDGLFDFSWPSFLDLLLLIMFLLRLGPRISERVRTLEIDCVGRYQRVGRRLSSQKDSGQETCTESAYRWLRPNVRSHHRLTTIHQEDDTCTPPPCQFSSQG